MGTLSWVSTAFKSWLHYIQSPWSGARYLISLKLSFLVGKWKGCHILPPTTVGVTDPCDMLSPAPGNDKYSKSVEYSKSVAATIISNNRHSVWGHCKVLHNYQGWLQLRTHLILRNKTTHKQPKNKCTLKNLLSKNNNSGTNCMVARNNMGFLAFFCLTISIKMSFGTAQCKQGY